MAWLEANRMLPIGKYHLAFCEAFGRTDVTAANLHALRKRKGWRTGRTGQFAPGQEPANKGKPMPYHPNSAATRFKAGERRGVAVRLYKPIGTERMSKDGYLERKINDGLPLQSRWRAVHLVHWEELHGPVPAGHALKCLDGDRLNTDPANWEAIPRGVLARLNGGRFKKRLAYDAAHPELKPTVMAIAKLQHGAHEGRKRRAQVPA
ncbi:HNH endonuclease [Sphingomonas sp.]|uniref:HNH endonuclease n=1 Tax=Sphingomonas sp. TaxID=28214 RepID=UPI003B003E39